LFQYGLGIAVAWQAIDDIRVGIPAVYSGDFFPWRRLLPREVTVPAGTYAVLMGLEAIGLAAYWARLRTGVAAGLLAFLLFLDNLVSLLNHRLLMAIELLYLSLRPVPGSAAVAGFRGHRLHWNLDLVRFQVSVVYFFSALHKMSAHFLSGEDLRNLFWQIEWMGWRRYPEWLRALLQEPSASQALALLTVAIELTLAVGLHFRAAFGFLLPVALAFHLSLALLMPFLWSFAFLCLVNLFAFLPNRIEEGTYEVRRAGKGGVLGVALALAWPGIVFATGELPPGERWTLVTPRGRRLVGYDAWVELLSLSPIGCLPAEILRTAPLRGLGGRSWRFPGLS
jgi:hypothetical protein